ncbi:carbohydrate ABC transporter permease [Faecalicatena sp.]|uniref:carbohydrate ABC transporter permease n=1 Tax=Faecalicatena sp. TaxID=2005360 RepID=UPI002A973405|nr:carbohydrate ABC transporter permease [Lachnospiraceae bacterium]
MIKRLIWGIIGGFMIFPLLFMVGNSFMGTLELQEAYGAVLGNAGGGVSMRLIPRYPTLRPLVELLMDSPGFFVMFWNSVRQVFGVLVGQAVIGIPAAWAFARYRFRGRRVLFIIYMILMIMPFQVAMVSNYLLLSKLSLMDTHFALILPGVFSTFPVFIMEKFFRAIPETMIEAAKVDGAGSLCIFLKIGLPLGAPGIMAALFLNFLEYWNAIEAPMTFLKTKSKFPLSLYLPDITTDQISIAFAASVVMMIPAVLGFLWGKEYLRMGIAASGLKE